MRALEVVDLDLDAAGPRLLEAANQLDADRSAVLRQTQGADVLGAHEPEVAVDVADRQPEAKPHRAGVHRADDPAVDRVGAVALVALHPVDVVACVLRQAYELGRVVLPVSVGVEDPVAARLGERGAQGAAIAPIGSVLDHPEAWFAGADLGQPRERGVARAIVDHNDLPMRPDLVERLRGTLDEARDRLGVVVTEQAGRDRSFGAQARAAHTRSTSSSVSSG